MNRIALTLVVITLAASLCSCALTRALGTGGLDLSSPDATVISFTKAAARGDVDTAQACFLPEGIDYHDVRRVLTAEPSSPDYPGKLMFEAIDPDALMPIISMEETENGLEIVWRVTFKRDVQAEGQTVIKAGDTFDFDGTLKKSGEKWLFYSL